MAVPDYTAADPSAPGGSSALLGYQQGVQAHGLRQDYDRNLQQSSDQYSQYTLPQLQSGIATSGGYYSSARQGEEKHSYTNLLNSQTDMKSALDRQLDELDRQRVYAALGLVV